MEGVWRGKMGGRRWMESGWVPPQLHGSEAPTVPARGGPRMSQCLATLPRLRPSRSHPGIKGSPLPPSLVYFLDFLVT